MTHTFNAPENTIKSKNIAVSLLRAISYKDGSCPKWPLRGKQLRSLSSQLSTSKPQGYSCGADEGHRKPARFLFQTANSTIPPHISINHFQVRQRVVKTCNLRTFTPSTSFAEQFKHFPWRLFWNCATMSRKDTKTAHKKIGHFKVGNDCYTS